MKNSVYIRKNEISKDRLKEFIEEVVREKESLERDFNDDFSFRYILVKYKEKEFYFDKETSVMFPVFEKCSFKKYSQGDNTYEEIVEELKENFFGFDEWELLSDSELRKCFYQENRANIIRNGKIIMLNGEVESFIVRRGSTLQCFDKNMEEIEEGYAIPVIRFINSSKELKDILEIWKQNEVFPIFDKPKQKRRYLRLLELYDDIKRYGILGKKLEIQNEDEIFKDLEENKFHYSIDEYKKKLLNIEKERIDVDIYDDGILFDSERGHWDIFYANQDKDIKARKVIKISVDEKLCPRDPRKDIRYNGVVAIDFGTKSTVVTCQKENDKSYLIKVGGGSYKDYSEIKKYENPTVMEFINIEKFMEEYNSIAGRPFTKWEDLKISHTAVSDFIAGSTSVVEGLKQWCGNKNETFIIYDKKGKKIELAPYLESDVNIIDPIELYAYYIGSYINNMHTGDIFLEYLLSFPITYEKEIRKKMLKSFENGIKKSLPISILDDKEIMEEFSISSGTNEPTAYALCALNEFDLIPKESGEKLYYGVFDFGGGTTDFTFGICTKSETRRYDYEIKHFGENGLKYLGGENILKVLSYEVFKDEIKKMIKENIPLFCPEGCDSKFLGNENIIMNSYEAKFNMKQLCEKLRLFWEEPEEFEKEREGKLKVSLLKKDGERVDGVELDYDEDKLKVIIEDMILDGINNFLNALTLIFKNNSLMNGIENLTIFLAGNSSKNSVVQRLFNEKLAEYEKAMNNGENKKRFNLYLPLGSKNNFKEQKKHEDGTLLNGKTGTAYGLLETRAGGRVKIVAVDEIKNNSEINFKYYVGYASNGKLKVILNYKNGYGKWVEFLDAGVKKSDIYYSDKQIAIEGNLSTEDASVKRKRIIIDRIDENANIYIRLKDSETIEYVVAYDEEIKEEKRLDGIKELKLDIL